MSEGIGYPVDRVVICDAYAESDRHLPARGRRV